MCMFVHLTHLVLSYATLLFEIFCGSFLIKNHIVQNTGKLEHRIDSLSSLGHIASEWEASSSQPTIIILDVIAVYLCFPKLLSTKNQSRTVVKIVTVGWKMLPHQI